MLATKDTSEQSKQWDEYERAATALENGDVEIHGKAGEIAERAVLVAERKLKDAQDSAELDNYAAQILRECIREEKDLP